MQIESALPLSTYRNCHCDLHPYFFVREKAEPEGVLVYCRVHPYLPIRGCHGSRDLQR